MIVVFVRHGAVRNGESNPELTSYGHRMSFEVGTWLKTKGILLQSCWSTQTIRTQQTVENILLACELLLPIQPFKMTEFDLNLQEIFTILNSDKTVGTWLFSCHQPLMSLLRTRYVPNSPPIRFATAFIMRYAEGNLVCTDVWPGRQSY